QGALVARPPKRGRPANRAGLPDSVRSSLPRGWRHQFLLAQEQKTTQKRKACDRAVSPDDPHVAILDVLVQAARCRASGGSECCLQVPARIFLITDESESTPENSQAKIAGEKLDLQRVVLGRLFRLGTTVDDDLVQDVELGPKPVLAREPLQITGIVDQHLVDKTALVLAERNDLGGVVRHDLAPSVGLEKLGAWKAN